MIKASLSLALLLAAASAVAQAPPSHGPTMRGDGPPPAETPFHVVRADPALDALVAPNAKAEEMARGFGLNEGVTWVHDGKSGYLLVSGLLDNVIYKIVPPGAVSVFMEKAGFSGDDPSDTGTQTRSGRSHVILIGPSCTGLDSQGRLIWCADNDRAVMRLEKDGVTRTVLARGGPDGRRFSGPNDISIARDDTIYLTDNDFGLRDAGKSPDKQMPNGVWRIRDGKATLLLTSNDLGGLPNGITLSPDEKYLYLTAFQKIKRYELRPNGTLGPGMIFAQGPGIGDGMKVDIHGNVFSSGGAGPGIIRITSPEGKLLGLLHMPIYGGEPKRQVCATNIAFGGTDNRSLFVAACDRVYRIRLKTVGIATGPRP